MRFVPLILLLLVGCSKPTNPKSNTKSILPGTVNALTTFTNLISDPVPPGVSLIEGGAESWQGYTVYLRFTADDRTISEWLRSGYSPTSFPWRAEKLMLRTPPKFTGGWTPPRTSCFKQSVTNAWTHSGEHYLLIDRTNHLVYFIGVGS